MIIQCRANHKTICVSRDEDWTNSEYTELFTEYDNAIILTVEPGLDAVDEQTAVYRVSKTTWPVILLAEPWVLSPIELYFQMTLLLYRNNVLLQFVVEHGIFYLTATDRVGWPRDFPPTPTGLGMLLAQRFTWSIDPWFVWWIWSHAVVLVTVNTLAWNMICQFSV